MTKQLEIIRSGRHFILSLIESLSTEQLNAIPPGFNNNIIWNLGHLIAAQEGVCYRRAGLDMHIEEDFFEAYKPGSKPEGRVDDGGIQNIKEMLFTSLDQLEADVANGVINNYPAWSTRYGVTLASIDDAVGFLPFHDGMHQGIIMAQKKLVS